MLTHILKRLCYMIILLLIVSFVAFVIIQLPPGDIVTERIAQLQASGSNVDKALVDSLVKQYGLDLPFFKQYLKWMGDIAQGDLGMSFTYNRPVKTLLAERLPLTLVLSISTVIFTYLVAIPIGIHSATHQYALSDYAATFFGFIGLAVPNFILALALMLLFNRYFNISVGGLFSPDFLDAQWSFAKLWDLIKHLPVPVIVVGTAGTAAIVRVMRGCLLDELQKQYVITARAKGLYERKLLYRYPVRVAMNPIVSTIGWILPGIISGQTITAIVLGLPTTGPLIYAALARQDMYLAGSTVMILSFLTIIGTFISDILLVTLDPRIRFGQAGR